MEFLFAEPADLPAIRALLSECQLPTEDISGHIENFIMAKEKNDLLGVIGLELHEPYGLVRSFAVVSSRRGQGLGRMLFKKISAYARLKGIQELYLFTDTAERFFSKEGFSKTDRNSLPKPIQATEEFKSLCPASVVCMVKKLDQAFG